MYHEILLVEQKDTEKLSSIVAPLLTWFANNARQMPWRDNPTPYWVWISEIMLQQTRVEAVRDYFARFMEAFPTITDLANVPESLVLKQWEGLGYYSRARNIHKTAKILCEKYESTLPADYDELLSLPGIGEYTAGAIASNVFGFAVPSIDGNVYRVISRILGSYAIINTTAAIKNAYFHLVKEIIPPESPGGFNQALMELGAVVCIPNGAPKCDNCPISPFCSGYQGGFAEELPIRPTKKPRKLEERTIVLISSPRGILLKQRLEKGLLASMWEPVNLEGYQTLSEVKKLVNQWGARVSEKEILPDSTHIFSHIEWHMKGFLLKTSDFPPPEGYLWTNDLQHNALPSAFREYTKLLPTLLKENK